MCVLWVCKHVIIWIRAFMGVNKYIYTVHGPQCLVTGSLWHVSRYNLAIKSL